MADGLADLEEVRAGARGLTYPFAQVPATGEAVEVAPGVLWLRLPLPMALDHVNLYAVEDGDGWTVVDTGLRTPQSIDQWEQLLADPLKGQAVWRVLCTHMHPDHIGLAGWLCRRFDAPLVMTRLEYVTARMLLADTGPAPDSAASFWRAAGWSEVQIERWRGSYGLFGKAVEPLPAGYTRIRDGDVLEIGGAEWSVLTGEGHSPEHACLWRKADGVLLGGDQILPRISSNVSVWPTEPLADPLGDWIASLERFQAELPDDLLVLPSHGEPFRGVQARLEALLKGHALGLRRLERALKTPRRAVDVFGALFARPVGDGLLGMATGEAIAHLNYLERRARISRNRDEAGVDWWISNGSEA